MPSKELRRRSTGDLVDVRMYKQRARDRQRKVHEMRNTKQNTGRIDQMEDVQHDSRNGAQEESVSTRLSV